MIHLDCAQRSEEWIRARLGKPTASEFNKILKPSDLGLSSQRFEYMYRLIWERIYQKRSNIIQTYWMQRGIILEDMAARECERIMGIKLTQVGLLTTDDGRIACSPDRIVDWEHAMEIKCPNEF